MEKMQNLILFETVTDSDGELGFEWRKKLKKKGKFNSCRQIHLS